MPNSAIERHLDRVHIRFLEAVHRMYEQGDIDDDQRDALIDLMEHIDEYSEAEFIEAWESVTGDRP